MRTSSLRPRNTLRPSTRGARAAAPSESAPCPNCAPGEETDLRIAVENLSRKYMELAEVVARYMSQAGLERGARNANARAMADRLARIIGGVETAPGDFPECCLLGRRSPNGTETWFCTGVLVHRRVVLTAGHCQDPQLAINVVALNAVNQASLGQANVVGVRRVVVNPAFPQTIGNDISVLILRRDSVVTPVAVATTAEIGAATQTTLVGFGNDDVLSTRGFGIQRVVTVDITNVRRSPQDDLDEAEQTLGFESDLEFTAGGDGLDSCNGDSGGPAYITSGGVRKVAGLTSRGLPGFANPCGDGGIYTRIDMQRTFINTAVRAAGINFEL